MTPEQFGRQVRYVASFILFDTFWRICLTLVHRNKMLAEAHFRCRSSNLCIFHVVAVIMMAQAVVHQN